MQKDIITPSRMRLIAVSAFLAFGTYAGHASALEFTCHVPNPNPQQCNYQLDADRAHDEDIVVRANARATIVGNADGSTSPLTLFLNEGASVTASNLHFSGAPTSNSYGAGLVSASDGSHLRLSDSSIRASHGDDREAIALNVFRRVNSYDANRPSVAQLDNVLISGVGRAVRLTGNGLLEMNGGEIVAGRSNGSFNSAVHIFDSRLHAYGTKISGSDHALLIQTDQVIDPPAPGLPIERQGSEVILSGAQLNSETGSAIRVDRTVGLGHDNTDVSISIKNGTSINAGNGVILEAGYDVRDPRGFNVNVAIDNSQLTGDIKFNDQVDSDLLLTNRAVLTGRIEGADVLRLEDEGEWRLVESSKTADVQMKGAVIDIHGTAADGQYHKLEIESLAGEGTFRMQTDLDLGRADELHLSSGNSSGDFKLQIKNTGIEGVVDTQHLVRDDGGNANFSVIGGKVDAGAYAYELRKDEANGQTNWQLVKTDEASSGTETVIGFLSALPTVWLGETALLRTHLGEVRMNDMPDGGVWARTFGNRFNARPSIGHGYSQEQWGVIFGADRIVGRDDLGTWIIGGMAGTSSNNLTFGIGSSGSIDSYSVGAYASWIGRDGYYFDGMFTYNRYLSDLNVRMRDGVSSKGDFANNGLGLSAEFGKRLRWGNGWFAEPYARVAAMVAGGAEFTLDNGMAAKSGRSSSVQASVGVSAGKKFDTSMGEFQPYVRTAVVQEFAKNNTVSINGVDFNNDLSGPRVEVAAGLNAQMQKNLQAYVDTSYAFGKRLDKPWGVNVGVRYTF